MVTSRRERCPYGTRVWTLREHRFRYAAMGPGFNRWKLEFNQSRLHPADRTCGASRSIPSRLTALLSCSFPSWVSPPSKTLSLRSTALNLTPFQGESHERRSGAQSHPGNHSASFHSNFVRLNMHQVKLPFLKHLLMNLVTMCSCSISPIGHGSFIQPEGMHNGLDRASIRHEGHHDHDQLHWLAQPLKHRSPTRVEGLFADLTAIAL